MGRYDDPRVRGRSRQLGGKVMRAVAEAKRAEAQARNSRTPHDRTRAHRVGRCECWQAPPAPGRRLRLVRLCPRPDKVGYSTAQAATFVLGKLARPRRAHGLRPYRCDCGAWHLGRSRRAYLTWRRAA